jgi:hypothetical protein
MRIAVGNPEGGDDRRHALKRWATLIRSVPFLHAVRESLKKLLVSFVALFAVHAELVNVFMIQAFEAE